MRLLALYCLFLFAPALFAGEDDYVRAHCDGRVEVVLEDRTRVDCLTDTVAWEYDFAHKWAESVGQALHYARMTDKRPGVVLIVTRPGECRHLKRLLGIKRDYLPALKVVVLGECGLFKTLKSK